jgi:hypothetical protein
MDENLGKVERPTDSKKAGGSAIQSGGNGNTPSHARPATNSTEEIDKRSGGTEIIGEING